MKYNKNIEKRMNAAIWKMIHCADIEAQFVGENLDAHKNEYIDAMVRNGLEYDEAIEGIVHYCEWAVREVESGRKESFDECSYRDEFIGVLSDHALYAMEEPTCRFFKQVASDAFKKAE